MNVKAAAGSAGTNLLNKSQKWISLSNIGDGKIPNGTFEFTAASRSEVVTHSWRQDSGDIRGNKSAIRLGEERIRKEAEAGSESCLSGDGRQRKAGFSSNHGPAWGLMLNPRSRLLSDELVPKEEWQSIWRLQTRIWKGLKQGEDICRKGIRWLPSFESNLDFWNDSWSTLGPLRNVIHDPLSQEASILKIKDVVDCAGNWNWSIPQMVFPSSRCLDYLFQSCQEDFQLAWW
ncbi:hypothetical protein CMV_002955 [Castanea mollissima]|uniref:Uncharacterized protein n=1 Tax=Castanea mollissima TaxID=60419 RepID=A0A8J4RIB2_9ROSI|nr:hypothetical protein CMV_002955 [Castanea mollissima]